MSDDNLSINEKYKLLISEYEQLWNDQRQDSIQFQNKLINLVDEFKLVNTIVSQLSLFSINESIDEIATSYLPFLNVGYYIGELYTHCLVKNGSVSIENKSEYLNFSISYIMEFLDTLNNYQLLNTNQMSKYQNIKKNQPIKLSPQLKRSEKIENFKLEKQLNEQLQILNSTEFETLDDEIIRSIYLDQLKLHILKSFNLLENIQMELIVLSNKPQKITDEREPTKNHDPTGFTTKLESLPKNDISHLISKHGKILKPFTITNKQELQKKVFGTGQTLPSMTVEEYLDYELKNGKMMKEEVKQDDKFSDDENSDDELEKRLWDDWKDENPKGSGNLGANIG